MDSVEWARKQKKWAETEKERAKKNKQEADELLQLIATPTDFTKLCEQGLLERIGPTKFQIPNPRRLPRAAAAKLQITVTETTVTGQSTISKKRECVGELWSRKHWNNMRANSRLLGEIIESLDRIINHFSE
jgi:hypothetical protein